MDKNNEYFERLEDYNFSALTKLNEDTAIFTRMDRTKKYDCIDASGETKGGCIAMMELKRRNLKLEELGDVFIESKKLAYLLLGYVIHGYIPLYINFADFDTEDGVPKKVYIWRLDRLSTFNYHPWTTTWSNGYAETQRQERFGLSLEDAAVYELDEKTNAYKMIGQNRNAFRGC